MPSQCSDVQLQNMLRETGVPANYRDMGVQFEALRSVCDGVNSAEFSIIASQASSLARLVAEMQIPASTYYSNEAGVTREETLPDEYSDRIETDNFGNMQRKLNYRQGGLQATYTLTGA
jgi:hypothetical protein